MRRSAFMRLLFLVPISTLCFFGSLVASHYCESVLLLTATYQILYNIISMIGDLIHAKISLKTSARNIFGWMRIKLLSLLISTLALASFCFSLFVEALQQVCSSPHDHEPPHPFILIIFGAVNFFLNILSFFLIGGYTNYQQQFFTIEKDLLLVKSYLPEEQNTKNQEEAHKANNYNKTETNNNEVQEDDSVNHHFRKSVGNKIMAYFRDIFGSMLVVLCGLLNYLHVFEEHSTYYIDPTLSFIYTAFLLLSSYTIMKESGMVLMQSIPKHIDLTSIRKSITEKFPAVLNIHDFHIWQLSPSQSIATLHLVIKHPANYTKNSKEIADLLKENGISSVTIQPEFNEKTIMEHSEHVDCLLDCKSPDLCEAKTCCGPRKDGKSDLRKRNVPDKDAETWGNCGAKKAPMVITQTAAGKHVAKTLNILTVEERVGQINSGKATTIEETFHAPSEYEISNVTCV